MLRSVVRVARQSGIGGLPILHCIACAVAVAAV
jgi:hypothetical protein